MSQTEYLETAEKLYEIYKSNNIFPMQWLTVKELEKLKGGPGLIASVKKKKGKLSELQPAYFDYVNSKTEYYSCNTPIQWSCKFDKWMENEYVFTPQEINELQADRRRQIGRETSQEVAI